MSTLHWVVIEVDAKQQYINASSRLRHAVAGSHIVHTVGTEWVREAARKHSGVQECLAISGLAILLVSAPETGRAIIEEVSRRALAEAAGLEVTGAVGEAFDDQVNYPDAGNHACRLAELRASREGVRAARPASALRDPVLPWFSLCRDTGHPVAGDEDHGVQTPDVARRLAQSSLDKWSVIGPARERMMKLVGDHHEVVPSDLDSLAEDESWMAVVHADGNGIGGMFMDFPEKVKEAKGLVYLDRNSLVDCMSKFSSELACATEMAFRGAVREVAMRCDATGGILPIIVGGDDVTFCCRADLALPLAEAYLDLFAAETREREAIKKLTKKDSGLTAASGIAFVKPHHPFSHALSLAEELTDSAKSISGRECQISSLDFQVLHDSTVADLQTLRTVPTGQLNAHGGPYVMNDHTSHRSINILKRAREAIRPPSGLSSAQTHDLRSGLRLGPEEFKRRLERLTAQERLSQDARSALWSEEGETCLRLLDAMLLNGFDRRDER